MDLNPSTPSPQRAARRRMAAATPGALAFIVALGACSPSRSRANEDQILRSAGLAPGERASAEATKSSAPGGVSATRVRTDEAPADVRVLIGPPETAGGTPVAVDAPAPAVGEEAPRGRASGGGAPASLPASLADTGFVDAVVGQINGRPVFASEFFAPMDARLRADAERLPPNQWRAQAARTIRQAVIERMQEELVLAEFQAALTPETRQGLFAFVERMRQEIVAQNLGSESLAGRRLQETEGLTLDEKVRQQRDLEIIRAQVSRAVGDRMYVSWREVELAYERDYDQYNPAPIARLRMIQVSGEEKVDAVRAALAAGEPFEAVARAHSAFRAEDGGLWSIEVDRAGYDATRVFAPDELNRVAVALGPGEVSEPFEWSGSTVWLTLEEIVTPPSRSLYDMQLEIFNRLRQERFNEERENYLVRLFGRASVTDVAEMTERLFEIAEERYLGESRTGGRAG